MSQKIYFVLALPILGEGGEGVVESTPLRLLLDNF